LLVYNKVLLSIKLHSMEAGFAPDRREFQSFDPHNRKHTPFRTLYF